MPSRKWQYGQQGSTYDGDLSFLDVHPLVNPAAKKVRETGMEKHLLNIELYGFSVVLPEEIDPELKLRNRLLAAILRLAEEATGAEHNVETGDMGSLPVQGQSDSQYLLYSLLGKDLAFEEAVQHPKLLAIMEYFLGIDCQLNNVVSFIKRGVPNCQDQAKANNLAAKMEDAQLKTLGLHIDPHGGGGGHGIMNGLMQQPAYPHVFNAAWCLTDYSKENGPISVVPGSHKQLRRPNYLYGEESQASLKHAIPVEAPAGSLVLFSGNVWHGAYPKVTSGLRVNLTTYYCGSHFKAQESYRHLDPEVVARNPPRFAQLVGWSDPWGFEDNRGPIPFMKRGEVNDGKAYSGGVSSSRPAVDSQAHRSAGAHAATPGSGGGSKL